MPGRESYIFSQEQRRELVAIERVLLSQGTAGIARQYLEPALGWRGIWSWYAVRIPKELLLPVGVPTGDFPGDVDLMGGPLAAEPAAFASAHARAQAQLPQADPSWWGDWASREILQTGSLTWPPALTEIGAAEVKASYLDAAGQSKATRLGRLEKFHAQAANLARMGFDRVALLWIPVTEPVLAEGVEGFGHWMEASARAGAAGDHIEGALLSNGAPNDLGELVLTVGAVPGAIETMRGSFGCRTVRLPPKLERASGSERAAVRTGVESFLRSTFERYPVPRSVPIVIRACAPGGCNDVFIASPPANRLCPSCGRET